MYIDHIDISDFRTFRQVHVDFVHPGQAYARLQLPKPALPNINLILGNNGSGKTTLLKAIALAALGPALPVANLPFYRLIRQVSDADDRPTQAELAAVFTPHAQDATNAESLPDALNSKAVLSRIGDVELPTWVTPDAKPWNPIFSNAGDAFFFVGYGATRRVETRDVVDPGSRLTSSLTRAQRVRSLFEEAYSLIPLSVWLPELQSANPGRYTQVVHLIERLLNGTGFTFPGEREAGEYVFQSGTLKIPFPALSDGYRAYLGWIGDLLYHVCYACPSGKKLVENQGMVLVDEIDLHLHPKWQMTVLPTLARALPNLQFIVTSHSPLVVGSLEWMNILLMQSKRPHATTVQRIDEPVHGLDADQVLLTEYFGLDSTRAPGKARQLKTLSLEASEGNADAALQLIAAMRSGSEKPA